MKNETRYFVRTSKQRESLFSSSKVSVTKKWNDEREIDIHEAVRLNIIDEWIQFKQERPDEWSDQNQLMVTKWEEWEEKQKTDKEKMDENEGSRVWWV